MRAAQELRRATEAIALYARGKARRVDEYQPSQVLSAESELTISLLPQYERLTEYISRVIIVGPTQSNLTSIETHGSVTGPAAGGVVATIAGANIPPGIYSVSWNAELSGTVAAAEQDNFSLRFGSNTLLVSTNEAVVGNYAQLPVTVSIPVGNAQAVAVKAVAAGTGTAVYAADLVLTPITSFPVALQLGDREWNLFIPATGYLNLSVDNLILEPQHARKLVATYPGQYSLEIIGTAEGEYGAF